MMIMVSEFYETFASVLFKIDESSISYMDVKIRLIEFRVRKCFPE